MTAEAELLLINASRAQLVREVIRPALADGAIVLCDRFFDSTIAYQAFGRGLQLNQVREVIDLAVGSTVPDLTLLLQLPLSLREERRRQRHTTAPSRDRMEEAGNDFFERVDAGYAAAANANPSRVKTIDASGTQGEVAAAIWTQVQPLILPRSEDSLARQNTP
jgi:dTMP kinase